MESLRPDAAVFVPKPQQVRGVRAPQMQMRHSTDRPAGATTGSTPPIGSGIGAPLHGAAVLGNPSGMPSRCWGEAPERGPGI